MALSVVDLHTKVSSACPPTGPNSFIFTYVFTKKHLCQRLVPPPMRVGTPPMGNPGSAPVYGESLLLITLTQFTTFYLNVA